MLEGTLVVGMGSAVALLEIVSTIGRHAYDGETLLVPGVPEAADDDAALAAAHAFAAEIDKRLTPSLERN